MKKCPSTTTTLWRAAPLALVLSLAACGGGGGGGGSAPPAPTPETLFVQANAWNGAPPPDAEMISPDEFRRRVAVGELTLVTDDSTRTLEEARQRRFEQDRAFLESLPDRSETLDALLAEAAVAGGPGADRPVMLPDGRTVLLLDLGTRLAQAADSYRRARDPALAREAYAAAYALLPADARANVPDPASLAGATLEQIDAAASQLDAALGAQPNLDNARLEPDAGATPARPVRPQNAGNGVDNTGPCTSTGFFRRYWFPLKNFLSPIKDQGERGTCWAFAAIAAVESRERVQNANPVDLSEQFLVNKVKREWDEAEFVDGYHSDRALNAAADRNQPLLSEAGWTYNRATGRPDNAPTGSAAAYRGACDGYTGMCSESAHQSPRSCTTFVFTFCGYNKVNFNGPGVPASRVRNVWASGRPFQLNQYRALLAAGYSLLASFPVYEGVMAAPATGIVSDYARVIRDDAGNLVAGSYGGHAVLIVGFLSNEELSFPGSSVNAGGGGYFVMRNSWGCAADGGYYYVPADYVSRMFVSLDVLEFDARRSSAWNAEQVAPGSTEPLQVSAPGVRPVDLRVPVDVSDSFTVSHPVATYVRLTVRSNVDGLLYDGQWLVNQPPGGSLFANSLPVTFQTEGSRTLTFTARYGTQVATATKTFVAANSAPFVDLEWTGTPQQGEPFTVRAIVRDINEPDTAAMCAAMQWSVDAPDAITGGDGCIRTIRFNAQGERELRVSTADREGLTGGRIQVFNVAPPPANPYPRILDAGVYSRDTVLLSGQPVGCRYPRVPTGATIDLRQLGCREILFPGTSVPRYFGELAIENPGNEALTYDWTYSLYNDPTKPAVREVNTRTTVPTYDFGPIIYGGLDAASHCALRVRVNAPEPARSKTVVVWTGRCINIENAPR